MRFFIDTEFAERGSDHPIELISIGIVAEAGQELYACNRDFRPRRANDWVRENVLPLLPERTPIPVQAGGSPRINMASLAWQHYGDIGPRVRDFIETTNIDDQPVQLWGYYCAYDYVVLSQLMGGMDGWPDAWPYLMYDLRQWLDERGLQGIRQPDDDPHDAIQDARWIRDTFQRYADGASIL